MNKLDRFKQRLKRCFKKQDRGKSRFFALFKIFFSIHEIFQLLCPFSGQRQLSFPKVLASIAII